MVTTFGASPSDLTLQDQQPQETIYDTLSKWEQYPSNIGPYIQPRNRPRLNEKIKHHFKNIKSNALFTLDKSLGPARRNAIERKIQTIWFDLNDLSDAPEPSTIARRRERDRGRIDDATADNEHKRIRSNVQLEAHLGILGPDSGPRLDPVVRFIALETSAPGSPRLKITDELLLKILTYHHVSPYFLEHISHICHEPDSGVSEAPFGGFRSLKSFSQSPPIPEYKALGRSGLHYQLIFDFKTVITVMGPEDNAATVDTAGEDLNLWPITQCAIYHRFDISTGKSIWILTPPGSTSKSSTADDDDDSLNVPPWDPNKCKTTSELLSSFGVTSPVGASPCPTDRFSASLAIMVWLADWSLSEYDAYIATLDEQMQILSSPHINYKDSAPIYEITLKTYNQYMETLDQVIIALESNLSTLQSLMAFYCDEFISDPDLSSLDNCPGWLRTPPAESPDLSGSPSSSFSIPKLSKSTATLTSSQPVPQTTSMGSSPIPPLISDLRRSLSSISATYNELIIRANVIKAIGTRRESTTHRLLQNRDTTTMKQLQTLTYIFSTITLLLLPMSVVSTIFSTDIVKFAFPSDYGPGNSTSTGDNGSEDYRGRWSKPAVVWWIVTTVLATGLVGGLGERWRRKSVAALKLGEGVVPSSRVVRGSSAEDLLLAGDGDGAGWSRRWVRKFKRGYADFDGQRRAKVQWVKGNRDMIWKRWFDRGSSRQLGAGDGVELGRRDHDPERAGGGGSR
ncbi:hypothetical protein V8F06_010582 [Rhypophila decipiens]